MYVYSATLQANPGRGGELASLVPQLRDAVSAASGNPANAWAMSSGQPIGTFGVSMRVEGNEQLLDLQQKMGASEDYQALASQFLGLLAGPAETNLVQIVGAAGDQGEPAPIVTVTQSTIVNGHLGDAMGWGMEVLEYVNNVTGMSGLFVNSAAGNFFDVSWIFSAQSGAELDSANQSIQADPGYIALIDKAGGFFVQGSAQRSTLVQMP
jgi:hypothetical protein